MESKNNNNPLTLFRLSHIFGAAHVVSALEACAHERGFHFWFSSQEYLSCDFSEEANTMQCFVFPVSLNL